MSQEACPPAARVAAAGILLDRGWGRATQAHTGEDGGSIRVVIRRIAEVTDDNVGLNEYGPETRRLISSRWGPIWGPKLANP
jgi:hypothetical protein